MKNSILFFCAGLFLASCNNSGNDTANTEAADTVKIANASFFGEKITEDNAVEATTIVSQIAGKDSLDAKVKGKIVDVCQKKGCWMNVDLGNNQTMRVSFKDYSFFVPKEAGGKTVVIEGRAYNDTTSVDELRHFASDAGKTEAEIAQITNPEPSITFEAKGVIIFDEKQ
jgi:hypothetical protein